VFGRATIRLGIGPHSSYVYVGGYRIVHVSVGNALMADKACSSENKCCFSGWSGRSKSPAVSRWRDVLRPFLVVDAFQLLPGRN